ncbi:MAG: hypothetical protein A2029_14975 [Chloroflexi bacterium RBG_19FT_COMBO_47_9]|nr:MAG: hypothetical protein A2029_14975 [Chloroflexi bacterium RBG_19FT_COMBO_47_9]
MPTSPNPDKILAMKIRSITYFLNPAYPLDDQKLQFAGGFLQVARPAFVEAGYEVQSARLATVPFTNLLPENKPGELVRLAQALEATATQLGYDYVSLGPALPEYLESYTFIPEALAATQSAFFSGLMTTLNGMVSLPAIHQSAEVIQRASVISPDGFANLRFAALANVPAGSPFFPAAYHQGGEPAFALATEAADLAVTAFSQADNLEQARTNLVNAMEGYARNLTVIANQVEKQTGVRFGGIDFSLAPFPSEERSIGTAFERLGVPVLGGHGSLAAAAILADTMDKAEFQRAGFSGLFLPVLEDATLARRTADGSLTLKDLLLYSAVCGTGLDTIPLPGDASVGQLSAVLLDLASLALRLDKPLTARLMPIPGKRVGDLTDFDFAYFANSRVMSLDALPLNGFLDGQETFGLQRRPYR